MQQHLHSFTNKRKQLNLQEDKVTRQKQSCSNLYSETLHLSVVDINEMMVIIGSFIVGIGTLGLRPYQKKAFII
jgi:hypothetical protein